MTDTSSSTPRNLSPRIELKISLQSERAVGFSRAKCPVCGKEVAGSVEMHEVFLTKGDVQGCSDEVREAINCRENCVLIHPACHPAAQHETEAKASCIYQLIMFNGYPAIRAWLISMGERMKGNQVIYAILRLDRFMDGLHELWNQEETQ